MTENRKQDTGANFTDPFVAGFQRELNENSKYRRRSRAMTVQLFYGTAASAMVGLWATLSVVSSEDWHARVSRVAVATRYDADVCNHHSNRSVP